MWIRLKTRVIRQTSPKYGIFRWLADHFDFKKSKKVYLAWKKFRNQQKIFKIWYSYPCSNFFFSFHFSKFQFPVSNFQFPVSKNFGLTTEFLKIFQFPVSKNFGPSQPMRHLFEQGLIQYHNFWQGSCHDIFILQKFFAFLSKIQGGLLFRGATNLLLEVGYEMLNKKVCKKEFFHHTRYLGTWKNTTLKVHFIWFPLKNSWVVADGVTEGCT